MLELLSFGTTGWGDELLFGLVITLQVALTALAIGLLAGLLLTIAVLSRITVLVWLVNGYQLLLRGVPEFLWLLIIYFGGSIWLGKLIPGIELSKFAAAVTALSAIFAAYAIEVLRGAWLAIQSSQIRAAIAFGFTFRQTLFYIRLPQMTRIALPGLANLWMVLLKDTSLVAVIALNDILRQAKVAGESSGNPLLFFTVTAGVYLAMTAISDLIRNRLERQANWT